MGDIVKLVELTVSHDTLNSVLVLLDQIRSKEVVGVAFVALYRSSDEYTLDLAGEAKQRPTFVRGALKDLDDQLAILTAAR